MRKLYIYKGIQPNRSNDRHYVFASAAAYVTWLNNYVITASVKALFLELDYPNYRITENSAVLNFSGKLLDVKQALYACTYAVDYDPENGIARCYWVRNTKERSGNIYLMVDIDYWGSFFQFAEFRNMHVVRCNKNISNGLYDLPALTAAANSFVEWFGYGGTTTPGELLSNYALVINLRHAVSQGVLFESSVSTDMLLAIGLDDLNALHTASISDNFNIIEIASRFVGGVYAVSTLIGISNLEAKVTQAWLIPKYYVDFSYVDPTPLVIGVKSKPAYAGSNDMTANFLPLKTGRKYATFPLQSLDKNKKWYVGGLTDGVEIQLPTQNTNLLCDFDCSVNNVKITIYYGDVQKDVTNCFALPILGNTEETDALKKISVASKELSTAISRGMQLIGAKTSIEAAAKGAQWGLDVISRFTDKGNAVLSSQNSTGDVAANASIAFNNGWISLTGRTILYSPLKFIGYASFTSEEKRAAIYGATFNEFSTFAAIFAATKLNNYVSDAFVMVDNLEISGIPVEAELYIESELKRGVYIYNLVP